MTLLKQPLPAASTAAPSASQPLPQAQHVEHGWKKTTQYWGQDELLQSPRAVW